MLSQVLLEVFFIATAIGVAVRKHRHGFTDVRTLRAFVHKKFCALRADFKAEMARRRAYKPGQHRYTEEPEQWTVSGLTERFVLELEEWNDADKKAKQSVAASLPVGSATARRDPFYAALSRAGLVEGWSSPDAEASQPGGELHVPELCFSVDDLLARLHGLNLQPA